MPRVLLHCFSGTGNTQLSAEAVAEVLERRGWDCSIVHIRAGMDRETGAADPHIFLFPVYATSMPAIMVRYIAGLPKGQGARAAVLSVNGRVSTRFRDGYQGWALHQARLHLALRGYDVFLSDTFDFPHNVTTFGPPRQEKYNRAIVDMAMMRVDQAAERIAAGERYHRGIFCLHFLWSVPFGWLYRLIGRRSIGKMLAADHRCMGCGLCARRCPVGNIRVNDKRVRFGWRCEGCTRCINGCPQKSIQLSVVRAAALVAAAVFNPFIALGLYRQGFLAGPLGGFWSGVADFILAVASTLITFGLLDGAIRLLGFVPGLNRVLGWGHTSLFGRYDAAKFRPGAGKESPDGPAECRQDRSTPF